MLDPQNWVQNSWTYGKYWLKWALGIHINNPIKYNNLCATLNFLCTKFCTWMMDGVQMQSCIHAKSLYYLDLDRYGTHVIDYIIDKWYTLYKYRKVCAKKQKLDLQTNELARKEKYGCGSRTTGNRPVLFWSLSHC